MKRLNFVFVSLLALIGLVQSCSEEDQATTLAAMNQMRANYGGGVPLLWDEGLVATARAWALELVDSDSCGNRKNPDTPNSMNVHVRYAAPMRGVTTRDACEVATTAWASQAHRFNFEAANLYSENTAGLRDAIDFINIIWQATTRVGCAWVASGNRRCLTVVCEFQPPVQYTDEAFAANVDSYGQSGNGSVPAPEADDPADVPTGNVFLRTWADNKCVDIPGNLPDQGVPLWQWTCDDGASQWFVIEPSGGANSGLFRIKDRGTRCWTVREELDVPGTPIMLNTCDGRDSQDFQIQSTISLTGWFNIQPSYAPGSCVQVVDGANWNGGWLLLGDCNNDTSQSSDFQILNLRRRSRQLMMW